MTDADIKRENSLHMRHEEGQCIEEFIRGPHLLAIAYLATGKRHATGS